MKSRLLTAGLILTVLITGCKKEEPKDTISGTEYGPVVEEDTRTDEEKQLIMIQNCISDYNTGRIDEVEDYLNTNLHPLPIGVTSLPEISSLKELTPEPEYMENSNVSFAGSYEIAENLRALFLIYEPTGASFWLNGVILFQTDPEKVVKDNPEYAEYRYALSDLLGRENDILQWLYGLNLTLAEKEGPFPGYYEVLSMGGVRPRSLDDIKAIAEQVFTKEYLEQNFYFSAFYNESAMFREENGTVYCAKSEMMAQQNSSSYNTHYIIAAEKKDQTVAIDLLSESMGEVQPNIRRLTLAETENGYRLPCAY